jgi:uncharacterized repeat protein (TIGR01451 family)
MNYGSDFTGATRRWLERPPPSARRPLGELAIGRLVFVLSLLCALALPGVASAATPQVSLEIEGPPGPLVPGSTIVYRVHVANPNPTTPTGELTVEANIPQYVKVWSATWSGYCDPVRCNNPGGGRFGNVVRWSIKTLEPKASTVLEISALVDNTAENPPPAPGTVIALDAIVKAGAVKAAGASTSAVVQLQKSLDLTVTGATRAAPGGELEYTFRYGNPSAAATNAVLHVPIPAGTSVVSASTGAERKGSAVEWNLGSLPAGRSDWRKLRLKLDAKAKEGSFFLIEPELRGTALKSARRATAATLVATTSPLTLSLGVTPDPAQPGGTLVYKLEITNDSPSSPTGEFTVLAAIPSDVHVTSATAGGYCDPHRCNNPGLGGRQGNHVLWKVASLTPGATVALQFTATVDKPSDAAPPPNGTIVSTEATAFVFGGVRANLSLAVGTAATAGNGKALAPLGEAAPVAQASPPAASPPESIAEPAATIPPPAEEFVEDDDEPAAVAVAADAKTKDKASKNQKPRRDVRWDKTRKVWNKYCVAKWEKREWDKRCMKRWRNHRDWAKRKAWWKDRWKES